jgi:hypothetical protein
MYEIKKKPFLFSKGAYDDSAVWPTCVGWTPNSEYHLVVGNQVRLLRYPEQNNFEKLTGYAHN